MPAGSAQVPLKAEPMALTRAARPPSAPEAKGHLLVQRPQLVRLDQTSPFTVALLTRPSHPSRASYPASGVDVVGTVTPLSTPPEGPLPTGRLCHDAHAYALRARGRECTGTTSTSVSAPHGSTCRGEPTTSHTNPGADRDREVIAGSCGSAPCGCETSARPQLMATVVRWSG